jgi:hypothetical protein
MTNKKNLLFLAISCLLMIGIVALSSLIIGNRNDGDATILSVLPVEVQTLIKEYMKDYIVAPEDIIH